MPRLDEVRQSMVSQLGERVEQLIVSITAAEAVCDVPEGDLAIEGGFEVAWGIADEDGVG